jgi:hypothetical protein
MDALACKRMLVYVMKKDVVCDHGRTYAEGLRANGWTGEVEILEVAACISLTWCALTPSHRTKPLPSW